MSNLLINGLEIHKFSRGSKRFAFVVDSLDFFEIDELVWDILGLHETCVREEVIRRLGGKYGDEAVEGAMRELEALRGDIEVVTPERNSGEFVPNVLLLQVSHACNLRCRFCYVQQVGYCEDKGLMKEDVARQAVEFLARASNEDEVRITFFGGEPMLNFPLIRSVVEYAEQTGNRLGKKFAFRLSTNGTLFDDENLSFFVEKNFDSIQISLDGPPRIHDRNRPSVSGEPSFDVVLHNVHKVMDSPLGRDDSRRVTVNAGYTRDELNIYETFLFLVGIGLDRISMSPYFLPESHPLAVTGAHMGRLRDEYHKIGTFYIELLTRNPNFCFIPFATRIKQLVNKQHIPRGCDAGLKSFAVAPSGDMYACQLLDGKEEYNIGNVFGELDRTKQAVWREAPVPMRDECRNCWIRHLCGGGCRAYSVLFSDGIGSTYDTECELEKTLMEEAIYLVSELTDRGLLEYTTKCLNTQKV